jgi:hypothetical protein
LAIADDFPAVKILTIEKGLTAGCGQTPRQTRGEKEGSENVSHTGNILLGMLSLRTCQLAMEIKQGTAA